MEVPKFQAKVSIPMVLREVFEALAVVDLDSGPISLIDGVLTDVSQVLWVYVDLLELVQLFIHIIDFIYQAVIADTFHLCHYLD